MRFTCSLVLCQSLTLFGAVPVSTFEMSVGPKIGAGLPFYTGFSFFSSLGGYAYPKIRLGYSAGLEARLSWGKRSALLLEVFYSQLGGNWGDSTFTRYDTANVVEVPVLFACRRSARKAYFSAFVGPDVLFKVGRFSYRVVDEAGHLLLAGNYSDELIRVPFLNGIVGVGLDIPCGRGYLSLDSRYNFGISSRFTAESAIRDWRQNDLKVCAGYLFKLGR